MVMTLRAAAAQAKSISPIGLKTKGFIDSLQQVYYTEQQWLIALPILHLAVNCEELIGAIHQFEKDGRDHLQRLENIFELLNAPIMETENRDVEVLIDECYDIIDITARGSYIRNAGLIVGMQQLQQYQITIYTSLLAQAMECGLQKAVNLLRIIIQNKQREEAQLALTGTGRLLKEPIT